MDDQLRAITEQHEHALERLNAYEGMQKGNKRWLLTAILTALGGAGGTGGLAYLDSTNDDTMETAVATHIVKSEEWSEDVDEDLKELQNQQMKLREAVIRLQVLVDKSSDDDLKKLLEGVRDRQRGRARRIEPEPGSVQKAKGRLFPD